MSGILEPINLSSNLFLLFFPFLLVVIYISPVWLHKVSAPANGRSISTISFMQLSRQVRKVWNSNDWQWYLVYVVPNKTLSLLTTYIIEIAAECTQRLHSTVQILQGLVLVVLWQGGLQISQAVLPLDLSIGRWVATTTPSRGFLDGQTLIEVTVLIHVSVQDSRWKFCISIKHWMGEALLFYVF